MNTTEPTPAVDIAVPVHNEEGDLERSVRRLHAYLAGRFPFPARITIVDNASTDATWAIAQRLAAEPDGGVRAMRLPEKGRGRALRTAWSASDAPVVAYMDVDLSTDLDALLPLVAPLLSGHSDVAIGSRLSPGSRVTRGPKREFISRAYNLLLRTVLRVRFRDAQCGFKAVRTPVAGRLLPAIEDQAWFFDTELLVLAERTGLRIHEVPVDWLDDPDSRVDIRSTAAADLRGIARLLRSRLAGRPLPATDDLRAPAPRSVLPGQVRRFVAIGVVSTIAYALLFLLFRAAMPAVAANALALLLTAIGNTAANRRLTFAVRGTDGLARDHAAGLVAFGVALAITSGSVLALQLVAPGAGRAIELTVLVVSNVLATVARFVLLRAWIDRPRRPSTFVPSRVERIAR